MIHLVVALGNSGRLGGSRDEEREIPSFVKLEDDEAHDSSEY